MGFDLIEVGLAYESGALGRTPARLATSVEPTLVISPLPRDAHILQKV
jgi:hypothetical protein